MILTLLLCPQLHAGWARPFPISPALGSAGVRQRSAPYLRVVGAVPLRFAAVEIIPIVEPAATVASPPAASTASAHAADAATGADVTTLSSAEPAGAAPDANHQEKSPAVPGEAPLVAATPPSADREEKRRKAPPVILPDDTPTRPRHEDFLPFFQFPSQPGAADEAEMSVPAPPPPSSLPPSSATYRQR